MRHLIIAATLGLSLAGGALAAPTDTTKPAATAPAKPMAAAKPATAAKAPAKAGVKAADRTPISKACSAQADAKKLHGKDRQAFRATCMKGK